MSPADPKAAKAAAATPAAPVRTDSATSGPVTRVKSAGASSGLSAPRRVNSAEYGYPNGHVGHLNKEEEEALLDFKDLLREKGLYKPGPPASLPDHAMLRFLRARRWVVQDAFKQFKDTEDWRAANNLTTLYETADVEAYEQSRRMYPQWTGRRDRRGIPIYLFEIRHLDNKTISKYEKSIADKTPDKAKSDGKTPARMLRLFALYENLTCFAQPLCTNMVDRENPHVPITLSTNIVDISGVSLRQFWYLKSHMQAASVLATAHYPETLDRIFIIGAPMFFPTVWGWIKRWFDPITVSKIFILSQNQVKPTLEQFIDPANIPKKYGGQCEFSWDDRPLLDPAVRDYVTWENGYTDFPDGPLHWSPIDDGARLECIAVGSVKGKERKERVCTIPKAYPESEYTLTRPAKEAPEANGAAVAIVAAELQDAEQSPIAEAKKNAVVPPPAASEANKTEPAAATPEAAPPAASAAPAEHADPTVTDGIQEKPAPVVSEAAPRNPGPAAATEGIQGVQNISLKDSSEDAAVEPTPSGISEKKDAGEAPEPAEQAARAG